MAHPFDTYSPYKACRKSVDQTPSSPPSLVAAPSSFDRLRATLRSVFIALVLATLAFIAWGGYVSRMQTLETQRAQLMTLARALEIHIGSSIQAVVGRMHVLANDSAYISSVEQRRYLQVHQRLKDEASLLPQALFLAQIDQTGHSAAASSMFPIARVNLADRDYFAESRQALSGLPRINRTTVSRISGRPFIPVSLALNSDAGFQGVLMAGLSPEYFQSFYESLRLDDDIRLDMVRDDGIRLLDYPFDRENLARDLHQTDYFRSVQSFAQNGYFETMLDGKTMLYATSRIGTSLVSIVVGRPVDAALIAWRQSMLERALIAGLLILSVGGVLWLLDRQFVRLGRSEIDLYRAKFAIDHAADMVIWMDAEARIAYVNRTTCERLGYSEKELLSLRMSNIDAAFQIEYWSRFWLTLSRFGRLSFDSQLLTRSGQAISVNISTSFFDFDSRPLICAMVSDISERKAAEVALMNSEQLLLLALDASGSGLFDLNLNTQIMTVDIDCLCDAGLDPNRHRYTLDEWLMLVYPNERPALEAAILSAHSVAERLDMEFRILGGEKGVRWLSMKGQFLDANVHGQPSRVLGTFSDVTDRKEAEARIAYNARFDALTGLANRYYLNERLRVAITCAERTGQQAAVLFIDLDHFKNINDSLGHSVGDEVLKQVAARLSDYVSPEDTLARLGGDEFLIVLPNIPNPRAAEEVASCIVTAMSMPVVVDGRELNTTPTIGISIYPDDGRDVETLISNADAAMYKAKARGRNTFDFYSPDINANAEERLQLENRLRTAHLRGELLLYYQPQIHSATGHVIGAEALMRWRHPDHGLVPPGKFIPIAETSGLIIPMGQWALNEACRQNMIWRNAGLPHITVAVNLSSLQFKQPSFVDDVADALHESGLPPAFLELELTESIVMGNVNEVIAIIDELKLLGVQLSIDDFGTGYSSLSYLKRFSVDKLKIDQSFVRDLPGQNSDSAIVKSMIALGKNLHLKLVAEGVETAEQARFLSLEGVDELQGYHFGRPMPADEFAEYLRVHAAEGLEV